MGTPDLIQHIRGEITTQVEDFQEFWFRFAGEDDPGAPHGQRVVINRFNGYIRFLGLREESRRASKAFKELRAWQKVLGPVRDVDVMRGWVNKALKESRPRAQDAGDALLASLSAERKQHIREIRCRARGLLGAQARVGIEELRAEINRALNRLEEDCQSFDEQTALCAVIDPWLEKLDALRFCQDADCLHAFRVRNKWLRFVLELLAEGKGEPAHAIFETRTRTCERVHTVLGNLNDLSVLHDRMRLERARWAEQGRGLEKSASALERGRQRLVRSLEKDWFSLWPEFSRPEFIEELLQPERPG